MLDSMEHPVLIKFTQMQNRARPNRRALRVWSPEMACNCAQRRQNIARAVQAVRRQDYGTVRQEAKDFAKSATQDVRRVIGSYGSKKAQA